MDNGNKRQRSGYDDDDNNDDRGVASSRTRIRRRKGFAYRYTIDEDYEVENNNNSFSEGGNDLNLKNPSQQENGLDDIIDVEATVQNDNAKVNLQEKQQNRRQQLQQQQSWEDRAQAYERVPPKNIKAWGPEGLIDGGIDIREYAARTALDEISKARTQFEKKEENVNIAENELIQLKRYGQDQHPFIIQLDTPL